MTNDILGVLGINNNQDQSYASIQAIFERPFSFNGRISRSEFAISLIIYLVAYYVFALMLLSSKSNMILSIITSLCIIALILWFFWAQAAKRCHDLGNSGWWQLIPFYVFWLLFQEGQAGQNEYGENPKGIQRDNDQSFDQ
jgi:uncharacterized membrane protein YhaH (DUF805 family)